MESRLTANAELHAVPANRSEPTTFDEVSEGQDGTEEPFEATIIRLDVLAAELLFRNASR